MSGTSCLAARQLLLGLDTPFQLGRAAAERFLTALSTHLPSAVPLAVAAALCETHMASSLVKPSARVCLLGSCSLAAKPAPAQLCCNADASDGSRGQAACRAMTPIPSARGAAGPGCS